MENFNIENIGTCLKDVILESKKFIDSNPLMVALSALSMMSVVLGNKVHSYDGTMSKLYPNIWVLLVAQSGLGSKSSTLKTINNMILKSVLEQNQNKYSADIKSFKSLSKDDKESADIPRLKQLISGQSSTFQGTIKALQNNPHGMIAIYDEARELLNKLNRNTEHKAGLTSLYDQEYYGKDLVGSQGIGESIIIKKPFLTILGVTNPDWLREEVSESDYTSGFFNRFTIVEIQELPRLKAFKVVEEQNFSKFQDCSLSIWNTLNKEYSSDKPLILNIEKITEIYSIWFDKMQDKYENAEAHVQSFLIRQLVASIKYASIIQIFDEAYAGNKISEITHLEPKYMSIGMYLSELFMNSIEKHIEYIGLQDGSFDDIKADKKIDKLAEKVKSYLFKNRFIDAAAARSTLTNNIRGLMKKNFDEVLDVAMYKYPCIEIVDKKMGNRIQHLYQISSEKMSEKMNKSLKAQMDVDFSEVDYGDLFDD